MDIVNALALVAHIILGLVGFALIDSMIGPFGIIERIRKFGSERSLRSRSASETSDPADGIEGQGRLLSFLLF
jgi:hypothetical protein